MESKWLKNALFSGMTANAFKLGTVLSLGWFWERIGGCSLLYRGLSMDDIDMVDILKVSNVDAEQLSVPDYIPHDSDTSYFYIVRRANLCGVEEQTLLAAVKVSFDANGNLSAAEPNNIFEIRAKRVECDKVELLWFYCPVEQKSPPVCFKLYGDNGTGQIDYENAIAQIEYVGRIFYSFTSESLEDGEYQFTVRAEDSQGVHDGSLARVKIQIESTSPDSIEIVNVETI
jgi:hypothetical protein